MPNIDGLVEEAHRQSFKLKRMNAKLPGISWPYTTLTTE